jgi:hypothetical protein
MEARVRFLSELRRLARRRKAAERPASVAPGCAFGIIVEERLRGIDATLREVSGRVNGAIFVVLSAVAVELVLRLMG